MLHWTLITLSSLLAITSGHVTTDGSKDSTYGRVPGDVNGNDLYQKPYQRSLALEKEFELQLSWFNWNYCTNAFPNASFTPMNALVPNNTIFLANYPTFKLDNVSATCKSKTVTRQGTISTGQQTVFFPLRNLAASDGDDDWVLGMCAKFPNETDPIRLAYGEEDNAYFTNATFTEKLYLNIDGSDAAPVYLYDTTKYYLTACDEQNKTNEEYFKLVGYEGDTCDLDPFQAIGGLDIGPMLGWYGIDTRTWADGETHTYEFGSLADCRTAKYILTAQAPMKEGKCGLLGRGIFCPFSWLKWLFGLFQ